MDRLVKDFSKTQINEAIDEWIIGRNAKRNRAILKRKLIDGVSYMALAEEFDMSLKRVKTVVREGTRKIVEHM